MALMDIAETDVVTADRETPIPDVLELMDEREVGSVVIGDGDEPIGIVTDRMLALSMRDSDSISEMEVGDVMTDELITIEEDRDHFDALQTMGEEGIRRIPVVDEDGMLSGIITFDDLIMVLGAEMSHASDVVEQQTARK